MTTPIQLLDIVALTVDLPDYNLWRGQVGTVVEILASGAAFEVEFCDRAGRTYESVGLRPDQLMLLHYEPLTVPPPSAPEAGRESVGRKKKSFISSTIRSEWNQSYNQHLCTRLESAGFHCFLPQRDVNPSCGANVFLQNTQAIKEADVVLTVVKNENVNLGVEAGFAFAIDKPIIILCDKQSHLPSMLLGVGRQIFRVAELEDIEDYIEQLMQLVSALRGTVRLGSRGHG